MPAINPTTHSAWVPTKWSLSVLDAREAPRVVTSRMRDRSSEVTGERMQVLNIGEMSELETNDVGDNGEVTDQSPPATVQTLTINQYKESTVRFRDDYKFQVAIKEGNWSRYQGRALKKNMEQYALALETGVSGTSLRDIAGSLVDSELLLLLAFQVDHDWPDSNLHLLVSGNQMTQIISDDRFSDANFIGDGNLPVREGKMKSIYGFEPLVSSLTRRRSVSGTTRTINMAWVGKDEANGGGAFVKGVQQDVTVKYEQVALSHRVIASNLYGMSLERNGDVYLMRTTDA